MGGEGRHACWERSAPALAAATAFLSVMRSKAGHAAQSASTPTFFLSSPRFSSGPPTHTHRHTTPLHGPTDVTKPNQLHCCLPTPTFFLSSPSFSSAAPTSHTQTHRPTARPTNATKPNQLHCYLPTPTSFPTSFPTPTSLSSPSFNSASTTSAPTPPHYTPSPKAQNHSKARSKAPRNKTTAKQHSPGCWHSTPTFFRSSPSFSSASTTSAQSSLAHG